MHFEGRDSIAAPIDQVWAFLVDPNRVAACAPGFQRMEVLADDHFRPVVTVGVGPVKATFTLDVTLTDQRPPHHAAIRARGVAAGSAVNATSSMDLSADSPEATTLSWSADVTVSGTLASVGGRLMERTAQMMTQRFFDCIRQTLSAAAPAAAS